MKRALFTIILAPHQASSGSLIGEVADDNFMQSPDISITVQPGATGFFHSAVGSHGHYRIEDLRPSSHKIIELAMTGPDAIPQQLGSYTDEIIVPGQNRGNADPNADHFHPAAISAPVPNTVGDAAIHRLFNLFEQQTIDVRSEVFNSLNNPNVGPFYGKAFSAGNPRRMQFALRYDF